MIKKSIKNEFIAIDPFRVVLFIVTLLLLNTHLVKAANRYEPNPIIFIHGFNPKTVKDADLWSPTYYELLDYLKKDKYFGTDDYCQIFDCRVKSCRNLYANCRWC